jgi:lipopolysaccharide/colanic/teichoic acid biosynthesis glycosyltransferase
MKMLVAPSSCKVIRVPGADALEPMMTLPVWKRTLDIACCLVAMPVFLVFTMAMALVTRLTSPGPIFFRQERVGFQGRRFKLYKFRTMHVRADVEAHQLYFAQLVRANAPMRKLDGQDDRRLISGWKLLRSAGLDELPQIINVLRGEMSIVGPRPCIPYELAQYSAAQRERFEAAPGLTGLWQVSGKNRTTFDEMIGLDIRYVRTRSLATDLRIICRTIPALCEQVAETRQKRASTKSESTRA